MAPGSCIEYPNDGLHEIDLCVDRGLCVFTSGTQQFLYNISTGETVSTLPKPMFLVNREQSLAQPHKINQKLYRSSLIQKYVALGEEIKALHECNGVIIMASHNARSSKTYIRFIKQKQVQFREPK